MTAAVIRPVVPGDAAALSALYRAQRDFLAPFEPVRAESFFTEVTQRVRLTEIAERRRMGAGYSWLILDEGIVAGMISLSNVIRGPFQSANIGYFVARQHNGRGLATSAVEQVVDEAFSTVGLHRVEAGTLLDNVGSQRVLTEGGLRAVRPGPPLSPHRRRVARPRALPAPQRYLARRGATAHNASCRPATFPRESVTLWPFRARHQNGHNVTLSRAKARDSSGPPAARFSARHPGAHRDARETCARTRAERTERAKTRTGPRQDDKLAARQRICQSGRPASGLRVVDAELGG